MLPRATSTRAKGTNRANETTGASESRRSGRSAHAAGLIAAALALAVFAPRVDSAAAADPEAAKSVQMVVDFGDGVEIHFTRLPWKKGQTVADAVALTDARPHGARFLRVGSGETLFVTQIGDVKNEGGGRDRRNWLYQLNGKLAENGIGAQTLDPGDVVLWKFGRDEYNSKLSK